MLHSNDKDMLSTHATSFKHNENISLTSIKPSGKLVKRKSACLLLALTCIALKNVHFQECPLFSTLPEVAFP